MIHVVTDKMLKTILSVTVVWCVYLWRDVWVSASDEEFV